MIFGTYPCCGGPMSLGLPDGPLPRFAPQACEHCGAVVWHKFSRIDPESWTDAQFRAAFHVDDQAKTVHPMSRGGAA